MTKILKIIFLSLLLAKFDGQAQAQSTQCVTSTVAGGTADALTVPLLPCGLATNILILKLTATNTSTTPTLQMTGYSPLPIVDSTTGALTVGALVSGATVYLTGTGTKWLLMSSAVGATGPTGPIGPQGPIGPVGSITTFGKAVYSSNVTASVNSAIMQIDASAGPVIVTVPETLGTGGITVKRLRVEKIDSSNNLVFIENTEATLVGALITPDTGNGGGWLDVEADGTEDKVYGVP